MGLKSVLMIGAFAAAAALCAEPDGKAAFERLKTLAGEWESKTKEGVAHVSYEVVSGGSALLERTWGAGMPEGGNMISVYHLDGNRLMMTHYCLMQNQPRLVAKSYDPEKGEIRFEFLDVTNVTKPEAGHVNGAVFRFGDKTHFSSEWSHGQGAKVLGTVNFELTRVK